MAILKCKMCGGDLVVLEGMTVCECEYCGTKQTVPTIDDEKKAKLFSRANKLRSNCEFDKAASVYESIVADYPEEAEGYWGLVLCRYGIEYVDDPGSGRKIPTCHRSSFDSIMDDEDFELVMENSDSISRVVYREEAKYIEEIRKEIIEVSGKEEPYDIFICYKETDENGDRTLDSVLAQDVYDELTRKGYRVFFSRITLEDKLGVEYEPYIFAALNSAKIMLAFGTSYDHYNAVWVKNEWSRFLKLMTKDKSKHLIPCFKNVDAYDIPKEFAKLQSQDMGKIGAVQDLLRGIDKLMAPESKIEKKYVPENIIYSSSGINGEALLKRGYMFIEDGEWSRATEFFEQALNINAEDGLAYWGELLSEHKCKDAEALGYKMHHEMVNEVTSEKISFEVDDKYPAFKDKFFFMEILSEEEIKTLFYPSYYYKSSVSSIEKIIENNKAKFVLAGSRLYQRALQYANDTVRNYDETLQRTIDQCLSETLNEKRNEEEHNISEIKNRATLYFDKLEYSLEAANRIAKKNYSKNIAAYQKDHDKWVQEKSEFPSKLSEWEVTVNIKKAELDKCIEINRLIMDQFNSAKKVYAAKKAELEFKLKKLEDEKRCIEGFMEETRIAMKDKKIIAVKMELSHLNMPKEPDTAPLPSIPLRPTLRMEPAKPDFATLIGTEEVIATLNKYMQE